VEKENNVMPAIYENELAGIFNHVLNVGIKHLIENVGKIKVTNEMKKATLDFHLHARDSIKWFNENFCALKPPIEAGNKLTLQQKYEDANPDVKVIKFTTIADMYRNFRSWLEDVEGYPVNKIPLRKHFAADLELYGVKEGFAKIAGQLHRGVYVGVKNP